MSTEGYVEATVIVEGALEDEDYFDLTPQGDKALSAFIERVEQEAKSDGLETEIYLLEHGHANDDEECTCAQYLTDHRADYAWNLKT